GPPPPRPQAPHPPPTGHGAPEKKRPPPPPPPGGKNSPPRPPREHHNPPPPSAAETSRAGRATERRSSSRPQHLPRILNRHTEQRRILLLVLQLHRAHERPPLRTCLQHHTVARDANVGRLAGSIRCIPFATANSVHHRVTAPDEFALCRAARNVGHAGRGCHFDHRLLLIVHHTHSSRQVVDDYICARGGQIDPHGLCGRRPSHALLELL